MATPTLIDFFLQWRCVLGGVASCTPNLKNLMTAEEFRDSRKALGLSMAAASRRCKIPYRTWQSWEDGTNRVPNYAHCFLFYLRHTSAE